MIVLGIETSGQPGSVALRRDGALVEERAPARAGRRHAQSLVMEIRQLFADHGLTLRECGAVAVSVGPGSFTGLRVGVVCAKTLVYAVGCPVVAVDTLLAAATNTPAELAHCHAIADAQRDELFVAEFRRGDDGRMAPVGRTEIHPAASWAAGRRAEDVVIGPGVRRFADRLADRCRLLTDEHGPEHGQPRAAVVAAIGEQLLAAGETTDVWTLEPAYHRRSSAEEKWDQRHGGES